MVHYGTRFSLWLCRYSFHPCRQGGVLTAFRQAQYIALAIFSWWVKAFPGQGKVESRLNRSRDSGRKCFGEPTEKWVWRWVSLLLSFAVEIRNKKEERRTANVIYNAFGVTNRENINICIIPIMFNVNAKPSSIPIYRDLWHVELMPSDYQRHYIGFQNITMLIACW
jgi:hypothetical protein